MNCISYISSKIKEASPVRIIVSSFFMIIVLGTILLMLPISSRNNMSTGIVDSFFVATSCTCVTGLTVFDTWSHWSIFGQVVIIGLIQLGGLGLITFTTGFTLLLRKKLELRDMQIAIKYTNGSMLNTTRLLRTILVVTFTCEFLGAVLLAFRFMPKYGLKGLWISVFTSISAYCNAGFDILGFEYPGCSLCNYSSDPLVMLVVSFLIILGGIGFIVMVDIYSNMYKRIKKEERHPRLTINSTIVLKATFFLLVIGTILFLVLENSHSLKGMSVSGKILASFFESTTLRTAGFFAVPVSEHYDITKILEIFLMFIGASPSSTGGGIKTTTMVVLLVTVVSVLKGSDDTIIRGHKVPKSTVYKSLTIVILWMIILAIDTSILEVMEAPKSFSAIDIIFESVSALGTVGISAGITPDLSAISKTVLAITMFIGRVGPISLIVALTLRKKSKINSILPDGKIIVG